MFYGTLCLAAMMVSFFAGGLGSENLFLVSIFLFVLSAVFAKIETNPNWNAIVPLSLLWLGAMAGMTWGTLRNVLLSLGVIAFVVVQLELDQKLLSFLKTKLDQKLKLTKIKKIKG